MQLLGINTRYGSRARIWSADCQYRIHGCPLEFQAPCPEVDTDRVMGAREAP